MSEALMSVLLVLSVGGVAGGLAAFLSGPTDASRNPEAAATAPWYSYIVLGIVASACVPLLLSLLKSGLISEIFDAQDARGVAENYLVLLGLAAIAGFSSRSFLKTISEQLLRRLELSERAAARADEKATDAKEIAAEVAREIEGADDQAVDAGAAPTEAATTDVPDQSISERAAPTAERPVEETAQLSAVERNILRSLTKMSRRTATGVAEDSGVSRSRVGEYLDSLADRGLVIPTVSQKTGGARWQITAAGAAALTASRL